MVSVILLGSKPGSVVALRMMLARGWDVRAVVTTDPPRHPWIAGPTLLQEAEDARIPVANLSHLPTLVGEVDLVISYMYRKLVRQPVLDLAKRAAVNFHAGPLPGFGGWAFYNVAILEEVQEYGCTCHHMDAGFDTGPVVSVRRFTVDARKETAVSLERRAQVEMLALFDDFCSMIDEGVTIPRQPQDPGQMRYMDRRAFDALKQIPPDAPAELADRIARAFWYPPYECAYVDQNGIRLEVVPAIAKENIARHLHRDDFDVLIEATKVEKKETHIR